MAETETIEEMTFRRDREITAARRDIEAKIAALQEEDVRLAAEHNKVRAVMETLGIIVEPPTFEEQFEDNMVSQRQRESNRIVASRRWKTAREKMHGDISTLPLTSLALRALSERFPEGTTTQRLHKFLENQWKRPQKVNSLQVTLSQLKQQGEIDFQNQLWVFLDKEEDKAMI